METSRVVNPIVDEFQQFTFNDTTTGNTLNYILYIPRDYDLSKSYPLVLFNHDSSVVSTHTRHRRVALVLQEAYATHPERFVRYAPVPPTLQGPAWINKPPRPGPRKRALGSHLELGSVTKRLAPKLGWCVHG
jgi:hypothetical protein